MLALLAVGAALVFLHWAARFDLTGPTGWSRDELRLWIDDPVTMVATVARWTALVLGYYLIVLIVLLVATTRSPSLSRLLPQRSIGPIAAVLGITAAIAPLRLADHGPQAGESARLRLAPAAPSLVLEPVPVPPGADGDPSATPVPEPLDDRPLDPRPAPGGSEPVPVADQWLVVPGESMWSIACDSLVETWGRPVTDGEIGPYWRRLIELNRDRLIDPANPDLILPGQQFVLPPVPPDPAGR